MTGHSTSRRTGWWKCCQLDSCQHYFLRKQWIPVKKKGESFVKWNSIEVT